MLDSKQLYQVRNEHGDMEIKLQNHIFRIYVSGSFNVEGIKAFEPVFLQEIMKFNGHPWAAIHIYNEVSLATPETYDYIRRQFLWAIDHNIKGLASVTDSPIIAQMAKKCVGGLEMEHEIFAEESLAVEWSESKLIK